MVDLQNKNNNEIDMRRPEHTVLKDFPRVKREPFQDLTDPSLI